MPSRFLLTLVAIFLVGPVTQVGWTQSNTLRFPAFQDVRLRQDQDRQEKQPGDKEGDSQKSAEAERNDRETKSDSEASQEQKSPRRSSPLSSFFRRQNEKTIKYSKRAEDFVSVFEPIVASSSASTVRVMSGNRQISLGVVVDSDGYVLTKASELKGDVSCKLYDGRQVSAKVHGIDPATDLAMLKVDIDELNVIQWDDGPPPTVGQWLATPNLKSSKLEVGVVGVNIREIPPSKPFIGIIMAPGWEKPGVKIDTVLNRSPADQAEIQVGDVITHIDDIEIKDRVHLIETVGQYDPGTRVTLRIDRADQKLKLKLELAERDKISPANDRSNQQNSMGSVLSRRRKNFPLAFQHDSGLNSNMCGGPVVNLDGRAVGLNIARAGRVSSLALPVETLLPIIESLKTGEMAPAVINQAKIAEIDAELQRIRETLGDLPQRKQQLESKYAIEKAKREELKLALKGLQERLKVIELKAETLGSELKSAEEQLEAIEKTRQRLEQDRKELATGVR
jgi:serine protease Do